MADISKINVNGTEYDIRSYVPFASTVAEKIGTFQGNNIYQIIVQLTIDDIGSGTTYASKTITLHNHYDVLNFSGIYESIGNVGQPIYNGSYYQIPEKKNLKIDIKQNYPDGSGFIDGKKTDITVSCDFWNQDTAKKDTNCAYVILTLIQKTR